MASPPGPPADDKIQAVTIFSDNPEIVPLMSHQGGGDCEARATINAYLNIGVFFDSAGTEKPPESNLSKGNGVGGCVADTLATGDFGIVGKTRADFPFLQIAKRISNIAIDPSDAFAAEHFEADYTDELGGHRVLWYADLALGGDGDLSVVDPQGLLTLADFEKNVLFDSDIGQDVTNWTLKAPKEFSWLIDIRDLPVGTEVSAMNVDSVRTAIVPEPASWTLFVAALIGFLFALKVRARYPIPKPPEFVVGHFV